MSTNHQRTAAQFIESNRRAAAVILAGPAKYGGAGHQPSANNASAIECAT